MAHPTAAPNATENASWEWPRAATTAPSPPRKTAPASISRPRRRSVSSRAFATRRSTGSMHRCYGTLDAGALLGLGHRPVEDLDGAVDELAFDRQGRDELEPVVQVAALLEQKPLADAVVEHPASLLGGWLPRLAVAHELEPDEQPACVDPAEDRMALLQLLEPLAEVGARLGGVRHDTLALDRVQRCVRRGRRQRRRREGRHVRARAPGGQHLVRAHDGRDRKAARQSLRYRHQVGSDAVPLARPQAFRASHARLDLVVDQKKAELVAELAQPAQVTLAGNDVAGARLHRLDEDGGYVRDRARVAERRLLAPQHAADEVDTCLGAVLRLGAHRAAVGIRVRDLRVPGLVRADGVEEAPHAALGGRRHRPAGRPVVTAVGGENRRRARVPARRLDRELDRVGPGGAEDDALLALSRRQLRQPPRQPLARLVREVEVVDELLRLRPHGLQDGGMPVAQVRDGEAGQHIDVLLVVCVPDARALAAHDRGRAVEQGEADLAGRLVREHLAQNLLRLRPVRGALNALAQLLRRGAHRSPLLDHAPLEASLVHRRLPLSRDQLVVAQAFLAVEDDERAVEDALGVFASRVDADGLADLDHAARLVDVPVEGDGGLVALDDVAHGLRAGGGHRHRSAADDRLPDRRHMQVEDGPLGIVDVRDEALEMLLELVLGQLARRMPGRRVGVAAREHLPALAEVDRDVLRIDRDPRPGEDLAQARLVVVPEHDIEPDAGAVEPLVRELEPAGEAALHRVQEEAIDGGLVAARAVELLLRRQERIEAEVADPLFDPRQLVLAEEPLAENLARAEAAVLAHDREDGLAGDVATHDEHVRPVEAARVHKLLPEEIGAVDVGGVVEREAQRVTSSGISYQRLRRPILARSFQARVFGASSSPRSSLAIRAATVSPIAVSVRNSGRSSRTLARLSPTVV